MILKNNCQNLLLFMLLIKFINITWLFETIILKKMIYDLKFLLQNDITISIRRKVVYIFIHYLKYIFCFKMKNSLYLERTAVILKNKNRSHWNSRCFKHMWEEIWIILFVFMFFAESILKQTHKHIMIFISC